MRARTLVETFRGAGTTRDWWESHFTATVTSQLLKTGQQTRLTVTTVTQLVTFMETTRQLLPTDKITEVILFLQHTADLATFMATTQPLLTTSLITAEWVILIHVLCLCTCEVLLQSATPTLEEGVTLTGTTRPLVAFLLTGVMVIWRSTVECFFTDSTTYGDGVQTAGPECGWEVHKGGGTTGTGVDQGWGQTTRATRAFVTQILTCVVTTRQGLLTWLLTAEGLLE